MDTSKPHFVPNEQLYRKPIDTGRRRIYTRPEQRAENQKRKQKGQESE